MVTYVQFAYLYLGTLFGSAILSLLLLPTTIPLVFAVAMWMLIGIGIVTYRQAHLLTRRAVAMRGEGVEDNPLARRFYGRGSQVTLLVSVLVQLVLGASGTYYIYRYGHFFTLFFVGTLVMTLFIFIDWYNDRLAVGRIVRDMDAEPQER